MRFAAKLVLAVVLAACLAGTADAQGQRRQQPPGGGGFGMMMGGGRGGNAYDLVATSKPLQEELKLSEETVTKLKEALKPIQDKRREAGRLDFNASADERKEYMEKMTKIAEESKKVVVSTLDEKQNKRLGQINYQMMGVRLFADKDAQAALKVTDEQKEKVKGIMEDFGKDAQELSRAAFQGFQPGGDREEMQKKMQEMQKKMAALTKETEEKVMGLMTDDQKKAHKELLGEKADTSKFVPQFGRPMRKDD
jgi:hypothetical protein